MPVKNYFPVSVEDTPAAVFPGAALMDPPHNAVKPLTVWTPDELLAWTPPANAVLLGESTRGYIVREELTVFIGPPGVGTMPGDRLCRAEGALRSETSGSHPA